jgi:hypothetical protein
MPMGTAVKRGGSVYVYDEKGRQIAVIAAGSRPEDGLTGYTSTTVSVRRGGSIYTYYDFGLRIVHRFVLIGGISDGPRGEQTMRKALPVIPEDVDDLKQRLQRTHEGRQKPRLQRLY